jgi:hypothetical protein
MIWRKGDIVYLLRIEYKLSTVPSAFISINFCNLPLKKGVFHFTYLELGIHTG